MSAVLLDTCAIIFIATGQRISATARRRIEAAVAGDGLLASPISAWEIGLLAAKKRIAFHPDPKSWFEAFLAYPGVRLTPLTPGIAIDSSFLGDGSSRPTLHGDPADRLLMATGRALDVPIMTRDRVIIDCARAGLVAALAC